MDEYDGIIYTFLFGTLSLLCYFRLLFF